jgi:hypothetical protein
LVGWLLFGLEDTWFLQAAFFLNGKHKKKTEGKKRGKQQQRHHDGLHKNNLLT